MHQLGLSGMPRRIADYPADTGWGLLNLVSTAGSFVLAIGIGLFVWNYFVSIWLGRGAPAGDDPWVGNTLEWATSSPPPRHNFSALPPIRSERPLFDARTRTDG
jgi:cytochrome c oxidase subunit 1/cytochrome c oxidase subunit I+III